jgi:hypothetical protein
MEETKNIINRREALRRTALVMGTALSASTIAGIMQGCTTEPELSWTPTFFNEDQAKFISSMAETIIPKTATPGAREVGVPKFIEEFVSLVYSPEQREEFMTGLEACRTWANTQQNDTFVQLESEQQTGLAEMLDEAAKAIRFNPKEEQPTDSSLVSAANAFWNIKELTVTGFFISEVGATQVLQYKAIPVDYNGCAPLSEIGRTWAT